MGDSEPNYAPRTIQKLLSELSTIHDVSDRSSKLDDLVKRLEQEMRKIHVFKRELPISVVIINDAITALKEESIRLRGKHVKPEMEPFIPLEKIADDEDDDVNKSMMNKDKKNWLSSARLWKTDDFISKVRKRHSPDSRTTKNAESGFHPFTSSENKTTFMSLKGSYPFSSASTAAAAAAARHEEQEDADEQTSSLSLIGTKNFKEQNPPKPTLNISSSSSVQTSLLNSQPPDHHRPEQKNAKKQRRCWSQELHRRFLSALQQLGGSEVSTPKQIKELMQVQDLTNDQVKSHLQKYRLHSKRAAASSIEAPMSKLGESSSMPIDHEQDVKLPSGSPQGPLDLPGTRGNDNSMEIGD